MLNVSNSIFNLLATSIASLVEFFEVNKEHIVTYSLSVLAKEQLISSKYAKDAMKKYKIDPEKPIPTKL